MLKHAAMLAQPSAPATTTTSSASVAMLTELHRMRPTPAQLMNLSQQRHALNVSTLSTSKHSLGNSSSVSPVANGPQAPPKMANGGLHLSRVAATPTPTPLRPQSPRLVWRARESGPPREALGSLGLLCLASLLLALLSLIFLLRIAPLPADPVSDEYVLVHDATLALCALALSLNLCCLLVCAVQFLFAVRLVRSPQGAERTNKYLQKSSITRLCAVSGFFISIPVFLTGIILYTFIQFHSTPAIITSVFIGVGIIFCGCAMVHNVFVWQREKTNAVRALAQQQQHSLRQPTPPTPIDLNKTTCHPREASGSVSPGVPIATLDLSSATSPHELSTLV